MHPLVGVTITIPDTICHTLSQQREIIEIENRKSHNIVNTVTCNCIKAAFCRRVLVDLEIYL